MAMESTGSAMTFQAAAIQRPTPIKPVVGDTDGKPIQDTTSFIDATTPTVSRPEEKSETGNDRERGDSGRNRQEEQANLEDSGRIKKYVENLNKKMKNSECQFGIHDETNRITIKIVDRDSKKVIKEYPPEKTLDMIAKVWELAGLLVDERG